MYTKFIALVFCLNATTIMANTCQNETIESFYKKIKESHPVQFELDKMLEASKAEIDLASQRPNPEVNFEYLKGDQFGLDVNTYSLGIGHTIEFGNKRDKRIQRAKLQNQIDTEDLNLKRMAIKVDALLSFQNLAQVEIRIKNLEEAIGTFKKISKRLSSRSALNPEERVSVSTLILATNDYEARLNDLLSLKEDLLGEIEFLTSCKSFKPNYHALSYEKVFMQESKANSGLIKIEELKPSVSKAEYDQEKSLGYSDIKIGPLVEYQNQGEDEFLSAGVTLSFSLPLFQTNDGGKRNALKKWQAQKIASKNNLLKLRVQKERLLKNYRRSLKTFLKMPKLSALDKKHQEVEKLFSRGIVSIPMVIESHRQLIDFLDSRFETENDLLTSLKDIALINGDIDLLEKLF